MNEEARLGMEPPVKMRTRTDTHSSESILEYGLASEVNEPSPPSLKGGEKIGAHSHSVPSLSFRNLY